ncbi:MULTISPECIES: TetR/AcrR family transcriptional regulator [unclassified Chelatococcus]|uniref:TetR/AcrR family transcriptional regulator n=1 Tax=unclassified Chelatococcus TaxID=2638111 RepID=UPI001BD1948E|nr:MULTISPECIES: TetR/AcrR family transcriptional regulator [unclassified Chelatococcus]MBS7699961.1 TetR family transcriptional regulator [Chelatococcus sp. YT9]MBX3558614.1 TetR family transcriptional regulator [Chelatococcus sp.]
MTDATTVREISPDAREAKRYAILTAAARIFNERGYHSTSMSDVADALGVSKPFLYYYIKDKEDLLFQCSNIATIELAALLDDVRNADVSGWERLEMLFRRYINVMTTDFGMCLIRNTAPGNMAEDRREKLWTGRRRLNREVERIIAQGIADGSIRSCDPQKLSFAMFGAFNWITFWYRTTGPQKPEAIADYFLDIFARGVMASAEAEEH